MTSMNAEALRRIGELRDIKQVRGQSAAER
jgi:hypothetical protein